MQTSKYRPRRICLACSMKCCCYRNNSSLTRPCSCLRALFPTGSPAALSSASAFCATYTTTINTATTGFPTRATGGCGTATARYSSACSCKPTQTSSPPTCTPTPTNNLVQNGGFECGGLDHWIAADVPNTFHSLVAGDNSPTAYQFFQRGEPQSNIDVASLSQDVSGLTVGAAYTLSFSAYFSTCSTTFGFVGIMLNHQAGFTFDACDYGLAAVGKFYRVSTNFTATANPTNLRFEFVIGQPSVTVKLDNIAITPA